MEEQIAADKESSSATNYNANNPENQKRSNEASTDRSNKKRNNDNHNKNNNTNRNVSHALSWVLRHSASNLGLSILEDGYVPVEEIIKSQHKKLRCVQTIEQIEDVVTTSDKQRFKLCEKPKSLFYRTGKADDSTTTILCIRANQGHSISTINPELLLQKLSAEELLSLRCIVHGSYWEPWNYIKKQGLKKMNRTHIHFASGLPTEGGVISGMRTNCPIHIFIDANKCIQDDIVFYQSDNGVILTDGINGILSPKYFSHVLDSSGNVLLDNRQSATKEEGTTSAPIT